MPSSIDRRRIVVGAAWSVPAVVVGSAVPAVAASISGCPVLLSADAGTQTSKSSTSVELTFGSIVNTPTIDIISVSGVSFTGPLASFQITRTILDITLTRSNSGSASGQVTVTYRLVSATGAVCGPNATFSFFYSNPPV